VGTVLNTENAEEPADTEFVVRSLERGLGVLKAFTADAPELTLSDVARRSRLSRAAAGRFVHTLVELGYLGISRGTSRGTSGRTFHLRPRVLDLGFAYLTSLSAPEIAHPYLLELSQRLERSTSLGVLDGEDVVYLDHVPVRRILRVGITTGSRLPAYLTSQGRMLVACAPPQVREDYLARVRLEPRTASTVRTADELRERLRLAREQGWCLVENELGEGVVSVSVPVRDASGSVFAAVNAAELTTGDGSRLDAVALEPLLATAAAIETDLRLAGVRA
jgi:IclR family pca regulon transcriptional regulator